MQKYFENGWYQATAWILMVWWIKEGFPHLCLTPWLGAIVFLLYPENFRFYVHYPLKANMYEWFFHWLSGWWFHVKCALICFSLLLYDELCFGVHAGFPDSPVSRKPLLNFSVSNLILHLDWINSLLSLYIDIVLCSCCHGFTCIPVPTPREPWRIYVVNKQILISK